MVTLPLSSSSAILENAGGKGASLARLTRLGLPVPPGFIVTTDAYRRFVTENSLAGLIAASLAGIANDDMEQLERCSARIRAAFSAGRLPEEIDEEISKEYRAMGMGDIRVAVRSSATTEDLPDLSFAGQQDTFLNVFGEEPLRKAIIDCWSSLWTARAIGYRLRNAIPNDLAALAVVVQQLVASEVSGVLFTANPLTGLLTESVIDATFGLGEALVSGQVEPDHFVVDSSSGTIKSINLGTKKTATRGKAEGGVETIQAAAGERQTLSEEQVRQLVSTGNKIQEAFGVPQDIEWAFNGGELFILQSRPITSLFPIPHISFDPIIIWFSFGAFQGLNGPMTPLGLEAIQRVVLGVGKKLGLEIKLDEQKVMVVAGERIWIKISDLIRNPLGNRILGGFLGIGEPGSALILRQLSSDPRLGAGQGRLKLSTLRRILGFILPALVEMPRTVLHPDKARDRFDGFLEAYLQTVRIPAGEDRFERLANFAAYMGSQGGIADALPVVLPRFMPIMATSLAALNLITHLLPKDKPGPDGSSISVMEITRGLPRNVTTEMDLALWEASTMIKTDAAAAETFRQADVPELAGRTLARTLPAAAQNVLEKFMRCYGMRGVGEIDLGRARWQEDPSPILQTLQSYLQIEPEAAPDELFKRSIRAAEEAIELLAAAALQQRGGRVKTKILRGAARRVRLLLGTRESPKFYAVRAMDIVRTRLLEIGEEFVTAGTVLRSDDLFFLQVSELEKLAHQVNLDWKALVTGRRQAYEREMRRRQVPRVLVSDGRAFFEGVGVETDNANVISGSPVSPGIAEGTVHVILDPRGARLAPGEILVCTGTDPAWTPLFLAAGGLVMEVGGMMTHGSVVAREYGIPAVVGVHQATLRLQNGQRIRLDGNSGRITML